MLNGHQVNIVRPFIRWAGGKQNLIDILLKNIPKDFSGRYFEPFLGAGSLFFAGNFKESFLSDVNPHLINAFKSVRLNPELIFDLLMKHRKLLSVNYYYSLRKKFNADKTKFNYEQAARFIFLVHTSYNGIYRVNRKDEYNVPIGKIEPNLPDLFHLLIAKEKLSNATLSTNGYAKILSEVQEGDFIYLDPPYPALNGKTQLQQFTINKFSEENQKELAVFSRTLASKGCKVLISNSDVLSIRKLYCGWKIETTSSIRYVSCKSERIAVSELLITNY